MAKAIKRFIHTYNYIYIYIIYILYIHILQPLDPLFSVVFYVLASQL